MRIKYFQKWIPKSLSDAKLTTYKINGNRSNSYEFNALYPDKERRLDIKYPVLDSKGNYAVLTIDATYEDVNKKKYTQNSIMPIKFNHSGITFNG